MPLLLLFHSDLPGYVACVSQRAVLLPSQVDILLSVWPSERSHQKAICKKEVKGVRPHVLTQATNLTALWHKAHSLQAAESIHQCFERMQAVQTSNIAALMCT